MFEFVKRLFMLLEIRKKYGNEAFVDFLKQDIDYCEEVGFANASVDGIDVTSRVEALLTMINPKVYNGGCLNVNEVMIKNFVGCGGAPRNFVRWEEFEEIQEKTVDVFSRIDYLMKFAQDLNRNIREVDEKCVEMKTRLYSKFIDDFVKE